MKTSSPVLMASCLALLVACQSPPPTGSWSASPVPATPRPLASPPTVKHTLAEPTLTHTPSSATREVLLTATPVAPPPRTISLVPVVPPSATIPVWTYWRAVDLTQGIQAVRPQAEVLWVGTPYGVYRVDPRTGAYTAYEEVGPVWMLLPVEAGQVWAVGPDGLFFFDGRQWKKPNGRGRYSFYSSIAIDKNGDLWQLYYSDRFGGTTASHFSGHLPPDGAWPYDHYLPNEVPPEFNLSLADCVTWSASAAYRTSLECQALQAARTRLNVSDYLPAAIDQDGSVWWITGGASVDDPTRTLHHRLTSTATDLLLPTARSENTTIDQDLTGMRINALAPDPEHGVWLGTDRGLLYSDGETIQEVPLAQDQPTLHAGPRNIAIDTQGNAWIVTAQGVQQLPAQGSGWQDVTDFGLGPGINEWPLGTLAAAREGGIWATHGGDLWRFGGSTLTPLTGTVPLDPYCRLIHLTVDQDGNIWSPLGVCGVAVFTPQTGQWVLHPSNHYNNPLDYSGTVWELFIDGAGVVYARGDSHQLHRFVSLPSSSGTLSQTWQPVAQPDRQLVLGTDAQGGQWTIDCRTGEVWRERAGTITAFDKVFTALPDSDCNYAYRWYFDSHSWLWVYDGVNLFRYAGKAWRTMHQPEVGFIADMTTGPDGRVWIVGDRGIAVYDPAADKQQ